MIRSAMLPSIAQIYHNSTLHCTSLSRASAAALRWLTRSTYVELRNVFIGTCPCSQMPDNRLNNFYINVLQRLPLTMTDGKTVGKSQNTEGRTRYVPKLFHLLKVRSRLRLVRWFSPQAVLLVGLLVIT